MFSITLDSLRDRMCKYRDLEVKTVILKAINLALAQGVRAEEPLSGSLLESLRENVNVIKHGSLDRLSSTSCREDSCESAMQYLEHVARVLRR